MDIRKFIILLVLQLVFIPQIGSAYQEIDEFFGIEKVMIMRADIQDRLKLTDEQDMLKSMIDAKYHPKFNTKFAEIGDKVKELQDLANSENCTKQEIDIIVEEFKVKENELFEINKIYEGSIKAILTPWQRVKYSILKFQGRIMLKRQLNNQIRYLKNNS